MSVARSSVPFTRVAIVSTGTEILQGLYADTNARYLAEQVSSIGLEVTAIVAAPDDIDQVESALRFAALGADVVICSGGLGPTEDDVNRDAFCRVFGCELVEDVRAVEMMEARFQSRGAGPMPQQNRLQALIPAGATTFYNEWGTAPGYFLPPLIEREAPSGPVTRAALIALPGPPKEMIPMFERYAEPLLRARSAGVAFVRTVTFHTFGRPESWINERIRGLFRSHPAVTVTILAKTYGVDVRITARGGTPEEMDALLQEFGRRVRDLVGSEDLYGTDEDTLPSVVGAMLTARGQTVTTAESCTGGLLAKLLTDVSGSSAYLERGYVVYSNDAKADLLGVSPEILESCGAVSEETAAELARGARVRSRADFALSVTGIAGPTGATPEKPVGLVYIGLATAQGVRVQRHQFLFDREQNRLLSALSALDLLRRELR